MTISQLFAEDGGAVSLTDERQHLLERWAKPAGEQRTELLGFLKKL